MDLLKQNSTSFMLNTQGFLLKLFFLEFPYNAVYTLAAE